MTKTQSIMGDSPLQFAYGQPVEGAVAEVGVRAVSRLLNWIASYRPTCHMSMLAAECGVDANGNKVPTLLVSPTAALVTWVTTDFWINADAALHKATFGAECFVFAGDTVEVTLKLTGGLGNVSSTLSFTNADNGTEKKDSTIDLSSCTAGEEWVKVEIFTQVTAGAGSNTNRVLELNFEENELVAADLPNPKNA